MTSNFKGTTKRITTSSLMLLSGIVSVLIGLAIVYLVVFRWLETMHILEAIGALLVSLWVLGSGGCLIYCAIREAKKSGKDE